MNQQKGLSDRVAERLIHMLKTDPTCSPGKKLPGEQQLCTHFGVSRTTVREAIRSLVAQGYLEVRRGSGTFILDRPRDVGLQGLEQVHARLRDLFEIRMMVEPAAARLACIRGTDAELREIAQWAQEVEHAIRTGEDFSAPEERFHLAIMAATHNPLMEQLVPITHNALHESWDALDVTGLLAETTIQDNSLLVGFFRRRDGDGARHAMAAHIRHTINALGLDVSSGKG